MNLLLAGLSGGFVSALVLVVLDEEVTELLLLVSCVPVACVPVVLPLFSSCLSG